MKVADNYAPVETVAPLRGLFTSLPSTRINPAYSPYLLNVIVRNGVVQRRSGYIQIGQRVVGRIMALVEPNIIDAASGSLISPLVVLTDRRQYWYEHTTNVFVDVTPGQVAYPIIGVNQATKKFTISGNHTSDFPVDRPIPVLDSTDNNGIYTVVGVLFTSPNTIITVAEAIPDATVNGNIVIADDWTLTENPGQISYVSATDLNSSRMIITNGMETPRQWDGTGVFADWIPNYVGFASCRTLAILFDHLFMGDINHEPALVGWSDTSNFDEFELGNSGIQVLTDVIGNIQTMIPLGDRLIIYSSDSIITSFFVGGLAMFAFETVIPQGTRLSSPKTVISINVGHVYSSEENFYLFDGTRGLRTLGDPVRDDYKRTKNYEQLRNACSLNDFSRRTLYLAFPDVDANVTIYTAEYDPFNIGEITWAKEVYANDPTAFGFYTKRTPIPTWADTAIESQQFPSGMPWEEEVGAWFAESEQEGFPSRVFGTSDGYVFVCDETVAKDNGVDFISIYDTVDFTVPEKFLSSLGRTIELEFEALGESVAVSISTDKGQTFTDLETVTLTGNYDLYKINLDTVARTFRIRFTITVGNFQLRWARLWLKEVGSR